MGLICLIYDLFMGLNCFDERFNYGFDFSVMGLMCLIFEFSNGFDVFDIRFSDGFDISDGFDVFGKSFIDGLYRRFIHDLMCLMMQDSMMGLMSLIKIIEEFLGFDERLYHW